MTPLPDLILREFGSGPVGELAPFRGDRVNSVLERPPEARAGDDILPRIDPSRCPICGAENNCCMAAGASSNLDCWCIHERFPPGLLERVPFRLKNKACICRDCLETFPG